MNITPFAVKPAQHQHHILHTLIIVILFCAGGCSSPVFNHESSLSSLSGEAILTGADVRNQALQLIQSANHSLYIEQLTLDDPVMLNEIIAKAQSGVKVKILLDRWQRENASTLEQLKNNNISAQYYPTEKGQYHCQKFIIADSRTVLFVSAPWSSSHAPYSAIALNMTGDTVQKALDLFAHDWQYTTTLEPDITRLTYIPEKITLTSTSGIKNLILSHIESAHQTIWIETQHLSSDEIVNALIAAQKRGCEIRIFLDASCQETIPNTLNTLTDAHIEYRFHNNPEEILYRNFAVFDTCSLVYTSSAWVYNTFVINHEGALAIPSPSAARKCAEIFQADWENG